MVVICSGVTLVRVRVSFKKVISKDVSRFVLQKGFVPLSDRLAEMEPGIVIEHDTRKGNAAGLQDLLWSTTGRSLAQRRGSVNGFTP